jgi:hypothetical protein
VTLFQDRWEFEVLQSLVGCAEVLLHNVDEYFILFLQIIKNVFQTRLEVNQMWRHITYEYLRWLVTYRLSSQVDSRVLFLPH